MINIPFVGPSYNLDALDISSQACKNMYVEVYEDANAKVQMSLRSSPGLADTAFPEQAKRCLYASSNGEFYGVQDDTVSHT